MKKASQPIFDHEAYNALQPERITRRVLMNGKYAKVSMLKLKPGEKRKDPVAELMRLRDEILQEEADKAAAEGKREEHQPRRNAA